VIHTELHHPNKLYVFGIFKETFADDISVVFTGFQFPVYIGYHPDISPCDAANDELLHFHFIYACV
jgi:hypothetical protein